MDLEEAICGLNWYSPQNEQEESVRFLSKLDIVTLADVFPILDKSQWENFVAVVSTIGFPKNMPLLPLMLEFLQDINWPGAFSVIKLFQSIKSVEILPLIEKAIYEAFQQKDFMWLGGLRILNQKIESNGYSVSRYFLDLLDYADF